MARTSPDQTQPEIPEEQIAAILEHRFGDSLVHLPRQRPKKLLAQAQEYGFIDAQGLLTRKGRALLARYH